MADCSKHPLYRAIQQSMVDILQVVVYDKVKDEMFAEELITLEQFEEYDGLANKDAVRKMTMKVMRSVTNCNQFLQILQDMPQQQYKDLATRITDRCDRNNQKATDDILSWSVAGPITSQDKLEEVYDFAKELTDDLLRQKEIKPIVEAMQLKRKAGKAFTEFLLYLIQLFIKAIDKKVITLKNSLEQSTLSELKDLYLLLFDAQNKFDDNIDQTLSNEMITWVVRQAMKVKKIINGLQKKDWLRWFRSARNISALIPILENITTVVEQIMYIDCRPFTELLGDVTALKASLIDIEKRILKLEYAGFTGTALFAIGSVACFIVGIVFLATPAAPAGLPFVIAGGAGIGFSIATGGGISFGKYVAQKHLKREKEKGHGGTFKLESPTEWRSLLQSPVTEA